MKQLLILSKNLAIKQILAVDDIIPVQDIISPQKTTFEVPINKEIVIGDLIILKNEELFEYFGVIQDLENDKTTKIAGYPLINITDGEYQLSTLNGDVYQWIVDTFTRNFVNTDDELLKLPFTFKNNTSTTNLKLDLQDGNLFDALLTIFKKTGIYVRFSLGYENGKAVSIQCNVEKADENTKITIRYDNPIVFETPAIELSQAQYANKIIFKPADTTAGTQIYTFYLLDNNTVTSNANASGRINGVVQSIQTYTKDNNTVEKLKEKAEEIMLGDTLNHQITLKVINNLSYNFQLYDKVEYIDEKMQDGKNRVFETYVTRIENNNEIYKVLRLGVLRTTLTDKVKALEKAVASKTTSGGNVSGGSVNVDLSNYYNKTETNTLTSQTLNLAKSYTDTKVADLIDSAPETLDTFKEIADAFAENDEVVDTLNKAIGNKADKTELEKYYTKEETDNEFATRTDLSTKANQEDVSSIKNLYLKKAIVENNILKITKQDNTTVEFQGGSSKGSTYYYGTCSTEADAQVKIVECPDFELVAGARISVYFENTNTSTALNLNVNGTGAIFVGSDNYGSSLHVLPAYWWKEGQIVDFVYNGSYFLVTTGVASSTSYGLVKLVDNINFSNTDWALSQYAGYQLGKRVKALEDSGGGGTKIIWREWI